MSIGLGACLFRPGAPLGQCLKTAYRICYGNSLYNLVPAHKVVRCLELIALGALLLLMPFSVTGRLVAFWRLLPGARTLCLRRFICGIPLFIQMEFILWDRSLLRVNVLGNFHLFLICSGGRGGLFWCVFPLVTFLTVLILWYGTCPILRGYYCEGSILFFPHLFLLFILILLLLLLLFSAWRALA